MPSSATSTASAEAAAGLGEALHRALAPDLAAALAAVTAAAQQAGSRLYLVGGVTRDLLLGGLSAASLREVDLTVVEGEAALLAVWPLEGWRLLFHPAFGTRHWHQDDTGLRLDLVRARAERYPAPGALPVVRPAGLDEDLARRDFSINALAWGLSGPDAGRLIDPWQGQADLAAGRLRALHPGSFQDDPTRIWRGLRYARRLGFRLAPQTAALIPDALPVMANLSGRRLANELGRVWAEARPADILADLAAAGVLEAIDPGWQASADRPAAAAAAGSQAWQQTADADEATASYLLALAPRLAGRIAARLDLPGGLRQRLDLAARLLTSAEGSEARRRLLLAVDRRGAPVQRLLQPLAACASLDAELVHALQAMAAPPLMDGEDLQALGVARGPELGRLLRELRGGQLAGRLPGRAAAEAALRAWLDADAEATKEEAGGGPS